MRDRLEVPLKSSIRKKFNKDEARHVTFESSENRSSESNKIMEKKSKTKQIKQGAERKRNTVADKEQTKKLKNNEVVSKVQEGREEATAAEELMRSTERKICEIKQNTAIRFKDVAMFISQVPQVEERKHKLRTEWADIERKTAVIEESKDLTQYEQAIEDHEQFVSRVDNGLDSIKARFDLLDESEGDVNELMHLINNLLIDCKIE